MKTTTFSSIQKILGCGIFVLAIVFSFAGSGLSSQAFAASTADPYTVLAPLPCIPDNGKNSCTVNGQTYSAGSVTKQVDFKSYVQYIVNLAIALSAVAAVFMIVWGGFEYITSTIPGNKSDGKKRITNAVYGLILVLCSYLILRTIDPRLVQIPDTLVAPLGLSTSLTQPTLQNFFTGIQSQADQLQNQKNSAKQNAANYEDQVNTLQTTLNNVNKQISDASGADTEDLDEICADPGSTNVSQLCAQRANNINLITTAKVAAYTSINESYMLEILQNTTAKTAGPNAQDQTPEDFAANATNINVIYNNAVNAAQQSGSPLDSAQKQNLDDLRAYSLATLQLQQDIVEGPSAWENASSIVKAGVADMVVTGIGSVVVPFLPGTVDALGAKTFAGSYTDSQQTALAAKLDADTDMRQYANSIQNPALRAQFVQNANDAIGSIGKSK